MADLTLVVNTAGDAAAVYDKGLLIDSGHVSDVSERLIERLGVTIEYADIIADRSARGWSGVAKTLKEIGL